MGDKNLSNLEHRNTEKKKVMGDTASHHFLFLKTSIIQVNSWTDTIYQEFSGKISVIIIHFYILQNNSIEYLIILLN